MKKLLILIIVLLPLQSFAAPASLEKHVSLINVTRTSTSTTYTFTADRNPIFLWDADAYTNVTGVYVEAVMRPGNTADTAYMILSTFAGADVTGSEITLTATTSNVQVRSGNISANLVDNTGYRARWKCDNGAGGAPAATCSFDAFRVIIDQDGQLTKTETVIEISEDNNVPSATDWAEPTDYFIYQHTAAAWDGTTQYFVEADLHVNAAGNTGQARLYDVTAAAAVADSIVTHTGNTSTFRKRSSAITLVDGHEYRPQAYASSTLDDLVSFKIIAQQTGTPSKTQSWLPVLNTMTSGTVTTYVDQNRELEWDASSWAGDTKTFDWNSTLKVSANTGYSQLFNRTDGAGAGIATNSTAATSYDLVASTGLTMPSDDNNVLSHQRKIDTSGTVTVARAFIVANVSWSSTAASSLTDEGWWLLFE